MSGSRLLATIVAGILGMLLLVPVALLIAPWLFVAWATRVVAGLLEPAHRPWEHLIEFDAFAGWKPRARLHTHHVADDLYQTTTDADGWRGRTTIDDSQVVVFGDSYVFGHAIDDSQHFAEINPGLRVKAIGVNGYSMVHALLWMQKLAPRLRGKVIVWSVYLGNDLTDNVEASMEGYRTPFVRENRATGTWEIVTSHVNASPWPSGSRHYLDTFSERVAKIFVPGPSSDRLYSACAFLIAEAAVAIREAGGTLVVLSIPSKAMLMGAPHTEIARALPGDTRFDVEYPDRQLAEICAQLGVPFVAGRESLHLRHYRRGDTHWNAYGHQRIADLLETLFRAHGPETPSRAATPAGTPSPAAELRGLGSVIHHAG